MLVPVLSMSGRCSPSCVWVGRVLRWWVFLGLLAGLGGVVSPLPSRCGFRVFLVVLCFLQVLLGLLLWLALGFLVLLFAVSFGVLAPFGILLGVPLAPSLWPEVFLLVVFCGVPLGVSFSVYCSNFCFYLFIIYIFCNSKKMAKDVQWDRGID